eukprot:6412708-Lingulodinium_polyedra.AAC.1
MARAQYPSTAALEHEGLVGSFALNCKTRKVAIVRSESNHAVLQVGHNEDGGQRVAPPDIGQERHELD